MSDQAASARGPLATAIAILRHLPTAITSRTYRRAVAFRTLARWMAKMNPDLQYLGLGRGEDITLLALRDAVITPYTVVTGGYQQNDLREVIAWCDRIGRRTDGVFVDVGANVGTTTLEALRSGRFSRAICIEPEPRNLALIRLNLEVNQLSDRVDVLAAAVSDRATTSRLYLSADNWGDHQIDGWPSGPGAELRESIPVGTTTLDDAVASVGVVPDDVSCVWSDTQGYEGFVLRGAIRLIRAGVPFCIEFWPAGCRRTGCLAELLLAIETQFVGYVDLSDPARVVRDPSTIREFARRFTSSTSHADLFLMPRTDCSEDT